MNKCTIVICTKLHFINTIIINWKITHVLNTFIYITCISCSCFFI
ncbi:MAG: hypothetical protein ACKPKO_25210 [Candidatus Fonsibacter sp.]